MNAQTWHADWKTHGSEYYECSRFKENPAIANEAANVKARKALEKYLHYYERWENHNKSLQLEQQLTEKIRKRIEDKVCPVSTSPNHTIHDQVNAHEGTWIDWQYLYDAATLLTQCRYTLQYTYPFAFYLPPSPSRDLVC
jgi:ariadne-2